MAQPLMAGDSVIDFALKGVDGATYDSSAARADGILVFGFWKQTCGTCQLTMPFLQRFADLYSGPGFQIWGVAQENADEAASFASRYGLTFPQLPDDGLAVTEKYDLQSVPAIYLVDSSPKIMRAIRAFDKSELNAMARLIADGTGRQYVPIVRDEDDAPDLKPG